MRHGQPLIMHRHCCKPDQVWSFGVFFADEASILQLFPLDPSTLALETFRIKITVLLLMLPPPLFLLHVVSQDPLVLENG
jgi:hypothetical protein